MLPSSPPIAPAGSRAPGERAAHGAGQAAAPAWLCMACPASDALPNRSRAEPKASLSVCLPLTPCPSFPYSLPPLPVTSPPPPPPRPLQRIVRVAYSVPPQLHLSEGCRDLLSRIFVKDPRQRISLAAVRQHPWYLTNLPRECQASALQWRTRLCGCPAPAPRACAGARRCAARGRPLAPSLTLALASSPPAQPAGRQHAAAVRAAEPERERHSRHHRGELLLSVCVVMAAGRHCMVRLALCVATDPHATPSPLALAPRRPPARPGRRRRRPTRRTRAWEAEGGRAGMGPRGRASSMKKSI